MSVLPEVLRKSLSEVVLKTREIRDNFSSRIKTWTSAGGQDKQCNEARRKDGVVAVHDSLLNIRGIFVGDYLPIERPWFVTFYPQTSLSAHFDRDCNADGYFGEPYIDMSCGEIAQSPLLQRLSVDSVQEMNYYLHLTDLSRYAALAVALYVQVDKGKSKKTSTNKMGGDEEEEATSEFRMRFFGSCPLKGGATFGPFGGRFHLRLLPVNVNQEKKKEEDEEVDIKKTIEVWLPLNSFSALFFSVANGLIYFFPFSLPFLS